MSKRRISEALTSAALRVEPKMNHLLTDKNPKCQKQ